MRKLIAAINMTLDGFCNHEAGIADEAIHEHYNDLLREAGLLLYGRTTYQLMEDFWPTVVANPTGVSAMDDFAVLMDDIPKIVYSRTLKEVTWHSATLKNELRHEDILALKQQPGKPIFAGSPSMIVALTNMGLIDEYQINIMPIILGSGLTLLKDIQHRVDLELVRTKTFSNGCVILHHEVRGPRE
ncbi:MAG: dihydrofolate reductase family protein [Bacteroidia bacterium]